ncbi:MAG: hypothetical protein Q9173_004165, partial [Seirophora scorigena]
RLREGHRSRRVPAMQEQAPRERSPEDLLQQADNIGGNHAEEGGVAAEGKGRDRR